jgi:hypothetical protein
VKILRMDDAYVWVQGDIQKDDAIVLERQGYLTLGTKVSIAPMSESSSSTSSAMSASQ